MAVYFLNMKTFGRTHGSSATGAIAYRAGERIRDERTGRIHDYSHRRDVVHKEIVLPGIWADTDMSWARDRATLWNTVEAAEVRRNARVARELLVALPAELDAGERLALVRGFSQELVDRHRFAIDFAIHAPRTDPRNHHAHLLATTREINSAGFGAKTGLELSDANRLERGLEPFFQEFIAIRERWATVTNDALRVAELAARIDHRSLAAQGIDREPRPQLPRAVYEMERRGERNEFALRVRSEYEARVLARDARAAHGRSEPGSAGIGGAGSLVADSPRTARSEAGAGVADAAARAGPTSRPPSLEDIRRQAREDWLLLRRESAAGAAPAHPPAASKDRSRDDDLAR